MNQQKKKPLFLALLLSAWLATAYAAEPPRIALDADQARHIGLAVAPVAAAASGAAEEGLRLPGSAVFPATAVRLVSAPAAGVVEAILADSMDQVAAGAPIVRLRSPQLLEWQRDYVQASVQAKLAADKLARDQALYREGIVAESRVQESRAALTQSEAARRQAGQLLKLAGMSDKALASLSASQAISPALAVSSPARGVLIERMVEVGQRVEAGAPLAKVAQGKRLWIELQATRRQGELIRPGDAVSLEGCAQVGKVTAAGAQLNEASQTIAIRAEFPALADCVRPNQHVEALVRIRDRERADMRVKASALVGNGGKEYVFVREPTGFRPVEVRVVLRGGDTATVRGALRPGDEVAVQGVSSLKGMWLGLGAEADKATQ
jgi:multidrug efflux pump subunit AcrA (membrane-fusion protein)